MNRRVASGGRAYGAPPWPAVGVRDGRTGFRDVRTGLPAVGPGLSSAAHGTRSERTDADVFPDSPRRPGGSRARRRPRVGDDEDHVSKARRVAARAGETETDRA